MKKKVLVTGYRGFLGGHMYRFLDKKKNVTAVTNCADLTVYENALEATRGMDEVYHFAAVMGGIGFFSQQNYHPPIANFLIDLNILRACEANKVKKLFYPASACAYPVYLMAKGKHLTEEMLNCYASPDQMYGWEKLTMVKLMRQSSMVRIGILHTIYGEGQEYEGIKAKFPPQMAYKALESKKTGELSVWGDGQQTRTFLHVTDAIRKIYQVMQKKGYWGEVNIGSDQEVSVNEVVKLCCDILKIKPTIRHDLRKPVGPKKRRCNNSKFNSHYSYRDKMSLEKGFRRLISYIKRRESK